MPTDVYAASVCAADLNCSLQLRSGNHSTTLAAAEACLLKTKTRLMLLRRTLPRLLAVGVDCVMMTTVSQMVLPFVNISVTGRSPFCICAKLSSMIRRVGTSRRRLSAAVKRNRSISSRLDALSG